ncbi:hypothetical protein, partial [Desulfatiferula olefinivorans]
EAQRFRRYRRHVYEVGALPRAGGKGGKAIGKELLEKERKREFDPGRTARFMSRTRYFTDSGIIGTRAFVADQYRQFKHAFQPRHEKKPRPITGLDGIYSLKR